MKSASAILLASFYGLSVRMTFGFISETEIMSTTFLVFVPLLVGAVTVLLIPRKNVKTGAGAFFYPWITCLVLLVLTMVLNIEGSICWIIIFPIFAIMAGIGGLIAYQFKKNKPIPEEDNEDILDGNIKFTLPILFLAPLILGYAEQDKLSSQEDFLIENTIEIDATPSEVWNNLLSISEIKNDKPSSTYSTILGFPKHLYTELDTLKIGGTRMAYYEKGLYFTEIITEYEENKKLVLAIHTDPENIPPTVMDEHILIGGKHLDILEDIYELEALPNGKTKVTLSSKFFINTPLNWYAGLWTEYLMSDILDEQLELIKSRSAKNVL